MALVKPGSVQKHGYHYFLEFEGVRGVPEHIRYLGWGRRLAEHHALYVANLAFVGDGYGLWEAVDLDGFEGVTRFPVFETKPLIPAGCSVWHCFSILKPSKEEARRVRVTSRLSHLPLF